MRLIWAPSCSGQDHLGWRVLSKSWHSRKMPKPILLRLQAYPAVLQNIILVQFKNHEAKSIWSSRRISSIVGEVFMAVPELNPTKKKTHVRGSAVESPHSPPTLDMLAMTDGKSSGNGKDEAKSHQEHA
ncbi:hypothetical protein GGP41_007489 [Bipolaris sorokiniana]|uniref:Uncharacterized protein n=1 Tax=Cochliobolus sativus TaxID=45130 RepID=A0A8H5Z6Q8_COCSA|nr:hypothetical protein GGP41_007489 [Bipolaris sorokiniana]